MVRLAAQRRSGNIRADSRSVQPEIEMKRRRPRALQPSALGHCPALSGRVSPSCLRGLVERAVLRKGSESTRRVDQRPQFFKLYEGLSLRIQA